MLFLYENGLICVTNIKPSALKLISTVFLFCLFCSAAAQQFTLRISGTKNGDLKIIDSISYKQAHPNVKSVFDEINSFSDKLTRSGYISYENITTEKINDSIYASVFNIGNKTQNITIHISPEIQSATTGILFFDKPDITLPLSGTETFIKDKLSQMESKGYPFAKIRLVHFRKATDGLLADLTLETGKPRQVNDIVINGYDKFPAGYKANIRRMYRNRTFNQETLREIKNDFDQLRFVSQSRYPEILFQKDTTKVYVYLEKAKPNKFEGFVGFANNDTSDRIRFNGYLDLQLVNLLNSGEEFSLYWKSDGNDQKTFNASLELPYAFKSRFGLKGSLNIFRQDSTFQTTKTALDIGYYIRHNLRTYMGYQSSESSDVQNVNSATLSDFNNAYITGTVDYFDLRPGDYLFPEKTRFDLKIGSGSRTSKTDSQKQFFASLDLQHIFELNEKNSFYVRSQDYYLGSNQYIINELFRFGGINSIRGFNENSLQGNLLVSLLTEYRYKVSNGFYIHSIIDYGYFNDKTTDKSDKILGLGTGFGILTANGLLKLVYANGSTKEQAIKLSNSIVHISFKTNF